MKCSRCGKQILPEEKFCTSCGTPVQRVRKSTENHRPVRNLSRKKIIVISVVILVAVFLIHNIMTFQDKYINVVRNGTFEAFPDVTVGEAFDHYFKHTKWTCLENDKESQPDALYKYDITFSGTCEYNGQEEEVYIWFGVDESLEYFECNGGYINSDTNKTAVYELIYNVMLESGTEYYVDLGTFLGVQEPEDTSSGYFQEESISEELDNPLAERTKEQMKTGLEEAVDQIGSAFRGFGIITGQSYMLAEKEDYPYIVGGYIRLEHQNGSIFQVIQENDTFYLTSWDMYESSTSVSAQYENMPMHFEYEEGFQEGWVLKPDDGSSTRIMLDVFGDVYASFEGEDNGDNYIYKKVSSDGIVIDFDNSKIGKEIRGEIEVLYALFPVSGTEYTVLVIEYPSTGGCTGGIMYDQGDGSYISATAEFDDDGIPTDGITFQLYNDGGAIFRVYQDGRMRREREIIEMMPWL